MSGADEVVGGRRRSVAVDGADEEEAALTAAIAAVERCADGEPAHSSRTEASHGLDHFVTRFGQRREFKGARFELLVRTIAEQLRVGAIHPDRITLLKRIAGVLRLLCRDGSNHRWLHPAEVFSVRPPRPAEQQTPPPARAPAPSLHLAGARVVARTEGEDNATLPTGVPPQALAGLFRATVQRYAAGVQEDTVLLIKASGGGGGGECAPRG